MKINLFLAMAAVAFTACQKNDVTPANQDGQALPAEKATVQFKMNTAALSSLKSRAIPQAYGVEDLRILAFRQNDEGKFLYIDDVDKTNITGDANGVFTGTAELPVGVYQFIPAFGLPEPAGTDVTIPQPDKNTNITDALNITHATGVLPAIFLQEKGTTPTPYTLAVNNTPAQVSLNLKRAVARVDVMFVRGHKEGDTYVEDPSDNSVFGTTTDLDSMGIALTDINPTVKIMDGALVTGTRIAPTFTINLQEALTKGTANGNSTLGTEGGDNDFENIKPESIVNGGAHIYGSFVFPYESVAEGETPETTTLSITVKSTYDEETKQNIRRTITVPNVKLIRNQVTLVKVFVPGEDLFHTNTTFSVTINKAWEYNNESWGEAL